MNDGHEGKLNPEDETVLSWVRTSILLDLWQDEEGQFRPGDKHVLSTELEAALGCMRGATWTWEPLDGQPGDSPSQVGTSNQ